MALTEDDFKLSTSQPLSNAAMLAVSKAKRRLCATLAVHVEGIWVGEHVGVTVSGLCGGDDPFAGFDSLDCVSE